VEKNTAGKWIVFAYGNPSHASAGLPITGDAANITANIRIDGGAANAVDDTNPTELEDGYYIFDITAVEANGDNLLLAPASTTADVLVIAVPGAVWTRPPDFNDPTVLVDDIWDEVLTGATHNIAASAGRRLRSIGDATSGTVNDAAATTTSFISTLTGGHDDHFSDQTLFFTDGGLAGMSRIITTYTSATKEITFDEALPAAPGNGDGFDVNPVHVHTQSQIAEVVWNEPLTGITHNITDSSGKRIRDLQEFGSYEGGAIFIDTVNGAAGTTDYESGTILNPVDTITDANTLATSLTLSRFEIAPASSIAFAASQVSQVFKGIGWTLALGGQDISDSEIIGVQSVTGTATTPTGEAHFVDCEFISGTLGQSHFKFCGLGGTLTLSAAANYTMSDCYSQIPGSPTPIIDFGGAVGNTGLSMRRYSGGIEVQNYGATGTDTMSLEGNGQLVIAASCTGGTIYVRGNFKVTDNASGAVAIIYDDNSTTLDKMVFTKANELDVNTKSINDAEVIGDGNATPWDGA
jgi:hypothetical protein